MKLTRSARWLSPALLLSLISVSSNAGVLPGVGFALHMLPALGQAAAPADAAPAAQPQAPEKAPANRKHLNVSVGPLRMHLPISGKRSAPVAAPNPNSPQQPAAGWLPPVPIPPESTIKGNDQRAYQPPQGIDPASVSEKDIKKPIIFRWTPVLPNPQDPVTYRLSVWQLMQGQTGTQAIKVNQPIITKDVDEPNLAFRPDAVTGSCQSPHLCDFVWNVQALDRMGRPIKGYNDSRQAAAFQYDAQSGAFAVQQSNSQIINNEDAPGLKKPKKSTGQKQYILGVNMSFSMVTPSQGGGNQPGGVQPMATPGPTARGVQLHDPEAAPNLKQVDLEAGKLKQNPKYILNRGTPQEGGNPPGDEQRRKLLNQQPVGSLSQSVQTAAPRTPETTGSTPHDKQSYSLKVVETQGEDAAAQHAASLPTQPRGITATANSSSAVGTKNAVIPAHGAPSPAQPKPGMIFDRWGNQVRDAGSEQGRMNSGAGSTQTRGKQIPAGGGTPISIGSGFARPAPESYKGSNTTDQPASITQPLSTAGNAANRGSGTGTPQPAGTPITAINILLPAAPDPRQLPTPGGVPVDARHEGKINIVKEWSNDAAVPQPAQPKAITANWGTGKQQPANTTKNAVNPNHAVPQQNKPAPLPPPKHK